MMLLLCATLLFYLPAYRTLTYVMSEETLGPVFHIRLNTVYTFCVCFSLGSRGFMPSSSSFQFFFCSHFIVCFSPDFHFKTQEHIRHMHLLKKKNTQENITLNMSNERIDTYVHILCLFIHIWNLFIFFFFFFLFSLRQFVAIHYPPHFTY